MDNCIIFEGLIGNKGYGLCYIGRKNGKSAMGVAHRVVYEKNYGPIPKGMVIRHKCDNPSCINIKHLLLGTQKDNIQDMVERKRQAHGIRNGNAKLTESQVKKIFLSKESDSKIAKRYGVTYMMVHHIRNGSNWRYVIKGLRYVGPSRDGRTKLNYDDIKLAKRRKIRRRRSSRWTW